MKTYKNVDDYIKKSDKNVQDILKEVRAVVLKTAPKSVEEIAYGMPAYKLNDKPLFYFAAMKSHLGIYPTPGPITIMGDELKDYSTSKGCLRIKYNSKLPKSLIAKLIKERIKEIKTSKI